MARSWIDRLAKAPAKGRVVVRDLYQGSGFARVSNAAGGAGCPLFVVSAGLGLLPESTLVPSYDLTLSPSAPLPIMKRITDPFSPAKWWKAIQEGPFAHSLRQSVTAEHGRIVVAVTRPYAELIGADLAALPQPIRSRLRIIGPGLANHLPQELREQCLVYDARLDAMTPGTRLDAAARACAHFLALVATVPLGGVDYDQALIDADLSRFQRQATPSRPRLSDAALRKHIARMAGQGLSATRALQKLRTELHGACEERRFRRLYQEVAA